MRTTLLKISGLCAACSLLAAVAHAQADSQGIINQNMPRVEPNTPIAPSSGQANRSWSTKKLSATGRNTPEAVRGSKLAGSEVKDSSGHRAGQIQDVIVNPETGRIDFALVSLSGNGTSASSGEKLVPVPWALLRPSASAQYSGGPEQLGFTLKADASKLSDAPVVDLSDLKHSEWRQRIYAYYGVTPPTTGAAESPSGEMKGQGEGRLQPVPPPAPKP